MEESTLPNPVSKNLTASHLNKIFIGVLASSVLLGVVAGYFLSLDKRSASGNSSITEREETPKNATQDNRTFRDFAEGTIQPRPAPKKADEYIEGTHFLIRDGAQPVALTSSVIDLTKYENKKVKVFGETQKAIKEGWLMDVGKIEVE